MALARLIGIRGTQGYGPMTQQGLRHRELAEALRAEIRAPVDRLLDVGCGPGYMLGQLEWAARERHGCDWLESATVPGFVYRKVDLNARGLADYPDSSFDALTASDVIEHLENPALLLREIRRVIKPDGVALLSIPNAWNIFERLRFLRSAQLRRYRSERKSGPWGHISIFTLDTLESLLDRVGLKLTRTQGGYIAFSGRIWPRRFSLLWSYNVYLVLRPRIESSVNRPPGD